MGLDSHQFTHQVDQVIQPFGRHPDGEGGVLGDFFLADLTDLFLLQQGCVNLGLRYEALLNQDLAEPFLHGEDLLHLHRREVAPFHQDLAEVLVV